MAIVLTDDEQTILTTLDVSLETAFSGGVEHPAATSVIEALDGYDLSKIVPLGDSSILTQDFSSKVKLPFKLVLAAFLDSIDSTWSTAFLNPTTTAWIDATLTAPWVNYGAPYANVSYCKDAAGWVTMRGAMKLGPVAVYTPFTLASGFRPEARVQPVIFGSFAGTQQLTYVQINADGTVIIPSIPAGTYDLFCFDGVRFKAA